MVAHMHARPQLFTYVLQVLWVAAAPKPRDRTALEQANAWMDYDELLKCSLSLIK